MKRVSTLLTSSVLALGLLATAPAFAAGSAGVERNTQEFLDGLEAGGGPAMETLAPADARAVLEGAQAGAEASYAAADVTDRTITVDGQDIRLKIVRPAGTEGETLPAFMFFHGGGWILGDFPTHERFVRDLVAGSGAVAVFVDYDRSPEVQYPVAINQAFAATQWVAQNGAEIGVDGSRLAVAGNSVGGNMATVVSLMAKEAGGPELRSQILFWPVTGSDFNNASYEQFQEGHFLTRPMMEWFWDAYTTNPAERAEINASPILATEAQLSDLPPALVQTAEMDVLRDEGEAYARKLDVAGVDVVWTRYNGMIHDFGLLNALSDVPAVRAALHQASEELKMRLQ